MKAGDLQVWWIPQVPMAAFRVRVRSLREARLVLDTLQAYDSFQLHHNIKPEYCNAGGLCAWCPSADDSDDEAWIDWFDVDGRGFDEIPDEELSAAAWEYAENRM